MSVDWNRVFELRDEIGPQDFMEVADLFLVEVEAAVTNLLREGYVPSVGDFHFIKSSALNLGFAGLAAICREGEAALAAGVPAPVSGHDLSAQLTVERTEFLENKDISGAAP